MKIEVTQEDITLGSCRNPFSCPIALAIKRVVKDENRVSVFPKMGIIAKGKKYKTPKVAKKFIDDFDHCREVKPFSFNLNRGKALV